MFLKVTVCFLKKQENSDDFKGDRDDEMEIILFWNIHRRGESCREGGWVFNERREYRATTRGDGGHRHPTHTHIAFMYVLYHRESENTPECTRYLGDAAVFSRHLGQSRSGGGVGERLWDVAVMQNNTSWHLEFLPLSQNPQLSREEEAMPIPLMPAGR